MDLTRLRQINEQNSAKVAEQHRHDELLLDNTRTQEVIVKSFQAMVDFLENRTSKTVVVNQLREIGTPDVQNVVSALDSLHNTLKQHKNTDLTEITDVMRGVLDEAKKIPKELPKQPEQKFVDYTERFKSLETAIKTVESAVKAQELKVEAPIVNVPETQVNVEAPDLKPISDSVTKSSKDVVTAVKGIKIPELNTDPVEKLLKKTNKLLEELPDLMPSGGSTGSTWIATNTEGTPVPIELGGDGAVTTNSPTLATQIKKDSGDTNILYVGKAPIGSATSSAVWQIARLDTTSGELVKTWVAGAAFTQIYDNREALIYS